MTFDPTKPVQTRDGRPARVICADARGGWPIIALIGVSEGCEETSRHLEDGAYNRAAPQSRRDLINVPEKRTLDIWVDINSFVTCTKCGLKYCAAAHVPAQCHYCHHTVTPIDDLLDSHRRLAVVEAQLAELTAAVLAFRSALADRQLLARHTP